MRFSKFNNQPIQISPLRAKQMILEFFEIFFTAGFWAATIRIACPLIFATLGEVICERSGVLNLGIEGIICLLYTSPSPRD